MKVRKSSDGTRSRWELDAGLRHGRRQRFYFKTKAEAERKLAELQDDAKKVGKLWTQLPARERARTVEVLDEMRNQGLTLDAVWKAYQQGVGKGEAVVAIGLGKAVAECMAAKRQANLRDAYLDSLDSYLDQFARGRGAMPVGELTIATVEAWINGKKTPGSRQTWRNRLGSFFAFCVKRGWLASNLAAKVEPIRVDYGRPKVLSIRHCRRLMRAAEAMDPKLVPMLALMLFAGVRPREVRRLKWGDVKGSEVIIDAAAAKKRDVRIAEIPDNARSWVQRPDGVTAATPVVPPTNLRRRLKAIRTRAKVQEWPHDVLRHTATSHWFQRHGSVKTARQMGHSERVMFIHYRSLVTERETGLFFKIRPR